MKLFTQALPSTKEIKAQENTKAKESAPKSTQKKTASSKPATTAKSEQTYPVPITIRTGYLKDASLNQDAFGKDRVSVDDIKKAVLSLYPWLGDKEHLIIEKKDEVFLAAIDVTAALAPSATVEITEKSEIYCGPVRLNSFSDGICGKQKVSDIEDKLIPGISCQIVQCGERLIVLPGKTAATGTVKLPLELILFNGKKLSLTGEDVLEFRQETQKPDIKEQESEEEEEGSEEESDEITDEVTSEDVPESVSIEEITKVLQWKNKTLTSCGVIYQSGKGDDVTYTFRVVAKKSVTYAAPKEKKFDISNGAVIRYMPYGMAADIKISPENFEGKTEINEDDFWKFSEDQYEEFDKKNSFVDILSSKERGVLLLVNRKSGSSKGLGDFEVFCTNSEESEFVRKTVDGVRYEKTRTHFMAASAATSGHVFPEEGDFVYRLPQLPNALMFNIGCLFRRIAKEHGTEAIVRIEYNPNVEGYRIVIPEQKVTAATVTAERASGDEDEEGWFKAVEIHSHGLFDAFFSSTDDKDETLSGIYGVIGRSGEQAVFRVCSGRYFTYIVNNIDELLENSYEELHVEGEGVSFTADALYEEWLSKTTLPDVAF